MRGHGMRGRGAITMEILTTLGITAMLMLSTAAATKSACQNVAANEGQFVATRTSRQIARQVTQNLRCAAACEIGAGAPVGSSKTGTILYVTPASGSVMAYVYDAAKGQLLLDTSPALPTTDTPNLGDIRSRMQGSSPTVVVVAGNVTSLSFKGKYENRPAPDDASVQLSTLVNVQVSMEVTQDKQVMRLCESVVPRRAVQ